LVTGHRSPIGHRSVATIFVFVVAVIGATGAVAFRSQEIGHRSVATIFLFIVAVIVILLTDSVILVILVTNIDGCHRGATGADASCATSAVIVDEVGAHAHRQPLAEGFIFRSRIGF
jgi:hypothetical protein